MDEIRIDRLALKLSGLSESQGHHLAMLITQGLAAFHTGLEVTAEQPAMGADVMDSTTEDLDLISDRVVAQILRQIERIL